MKYKCMGFLPSQQEDNMNVPGALMTDPDGGKVNVAPEPELVPIYETNDFNEARKIFSEGGYISPDDQWFLIKRVVDEEGNAILPNSPLRKKPSLAGANGVPNTNAPTPKKGRNTTIAPTIKKGNR